MNNRNRDQGRFALGKILIVSLEKLTFELDDSLLSAIRFVSKRQM